MTIRCLVFALSAFFPSVLNRFPTNRGSYGAASPSPWAASSRTARFSLKCFSSCSPCGWVAITTFSVSSCWCSSSWSSRAPTSPWCSATSSFVPRTTTGQSTAAAAAVLLYLNATVPERPVGIVSYYAVVLSTDLNASSSLAVKGSAIRRVPASRRTLGGILDPPSFEAKIPGRPCTRSSI